MFSAQFQRKKCKETPIESINMANYLQFSIITQIDQLPSLISLSLSLSLYSN
jgi:hypothetical protein